MESDPFQTQRDVGIDVIAELNAAGFEDAEEIGRGGFGQVYRCRQRGMDCVVAVKVLTNRLDENRERFLREHSGRRPAMPRSSAAAVNRWSQRTAEGHVEHILTKLGFTSRAQIAGGAEEPES